MSFLYVSRKISDVAQTKDESQRRVMMFEGTIHSPQAFMTIILPWRSHWV
jgi:hypothetical protein